MIISFVITTYNRCKYLQELIESMPLDKDIEIIIVDDNSTDDTIGFINSISNFKVKYVKNEKNYGPIYSRRKGLDFATGDYVCFCDDDDFYISKDFFEDFVSITKNEKAEIVCYNSYIYIDETKTRKEDNLNFFGKISSNEYLNRFQFDIGKPKSTFTTFFKNTDKFKKLIDEIAFLNDSTLYLIGLSIYEKVFISSKIIGCYRVHKSNITKSISLSFMVDSIKSKAKIYHINMDKLKKDWLNHQLILTFNYYLGSKPSTLNKIRFARECFKLSKRKMSLLKYFFFRGNI